MGLEIKLKELVSFSGYGLYLLLSMLSVCRRLIVSPKLSVMRGFLPLGFCHVCPLALIILTVVLFCIVPLCLLLPRGLILVVVISSVNFPSVTSHFVFAVFMPQTVTLIMTSFLKMFLTKLILLSPPFLWATSTPCLTG